MAPTCSTRPRASCGSAPGSGSRPCAGLDVPAYAHVPLVLGPDGQRLAKRHGAVTLADRAALGQPAADVRDELAASLGLCARGEALTPAELVERFSVGDLSVAA